MRHILTILCIFLLLHASGQDTTMSSLTRDMDQSMDSNEKKPVKIFSSYKAINANTTEVTGKGKMNFNVTHNFGDIGGSNGGIDKFFGLDDAADVRIGFNIGIGKRTDLIAARAKGSSQGGNSGDQSLNQLWQLGIKHVLLQQMENDPSHPLSIAIFADGVVTTMDSTTQPDNERNFSDFSDRLSGVFQLIVAKRMGKVSLQINPTYVVRGHVRSFDQKGLFALGGALRVPLGNMFNLVVDYSHTFFSQSNKDGFLAADGLKYRDALGIGFEILTAGHVFHLNFTNCTDILENRFIPKTVRSWGDGEFRWGFTISRVFVLWREKK